MALMGMAMFFMFLGLGTVASFTILHHGRNYHHSSNRMNENEVVVLSVSRYGPQPTLSSPPESDDDDMDSSVTEASPWAVKIAEQKEAFRLFVKEAMELSDKPHHLPRLLANNLALVVELAGGQEANEIVTYLLKEAMEQGGQSLHDQTLETVETILSFAEGFVDQALEMDAHNKKLLGKIIKAMGSAKMGVVDDNDNTVVGETWGLDDNDLNSFHGLSHEERLDAILERERDNFTPGFVKHLEGECNRIANAPKMTRESARLLEILRVIQARVLEEIGKDLGEAALVLGQLMGYENDQELLGVLEAGLTVRGRDFAAEMKEHTEEALDGFRKVPGGVDPELLVRVTMIDKRLRSFLDQANEFQ